MKIPRVSALWASYRPSCDLCGGRGWTPSPTGWARPCDACHGSGRAPSLYRIAKQLDEHPETLRRLDLGKLGQRASVRLLRKLTDRIAQLACACHKHRGIGLRCPAGDPYVYVFRHERQVAGPFLELSDARSWADANYPEAERCTLAPIKPRTKRRSTDLPAR